MEGSLGGGSGFFVHVPSSVIPDMGHIYAVTNRHVLDKGYQVLRVNTRSGGIETIPTSRDQWIPHPDGLDVEIMPFEVKEHLKWNSIPISIFVTREIIEVFNIGIGDEIVVIGRLVNHAGKQKNSPVVRFGNIALMADPTEPIVSEVAEQEAFLVECRSLSGFSGSPVLVTTSQGYSGESAQKVVQFRQKQFGFSPSPNGPRITTNSILGTQGPWFLGIDCGHIPLWTPVRQRDKSTGIIDTATDTQLRVEANTGVACVLPAWHVMTILDSPELVRERKAEEKKLAEKQQTEHQKPV